jgi:hypothetical protein
VVVGLVFGFSSLSGQAATLSATAHVFLILGLLSFVGAAALGLACGWPIRHKEASLASLQPLVEKIGKEEGAEGRTRHSAAVRFEVLEWLREVNKRKARLLTVAMALELGPSSCWSSSESSSSAPTRSPHEPRFSRKFPRTLRA